MSIPTTNISGLDIRVQLYGSAGAFSPLETICRDAVRKPSGAVAYTDFGGWGWSQGRYAAQNQSGQAIYPYYLDTRADGSPLGTGFKWKVNLVGNLPQWEGEVRPRDTGASGSITGQSWFRASKSSAHNLHFTSSGIREILSSSNVEPEAYVIQCSAGYLSGSRTNLTSAYKISAGSGVISTRDNTIPFTPTAGWYVTPVFSIRWPAHSGYLDKYNIKISSARVIA